MTTNRRRKLDTRELAASAGIPYTAALRASQAGLGILDDATPPADWRSLDHLPFVFAILRDRDEHGIGDELVVFDRAGNRVAEMTVPHVPTEQLLADYADAFAAMLVQGSPAHLQLENVVRLGRPDLLFHRLGYDPLSLSFWQQWSDGSYRCVGTASDYTHSVTVTPLDVEDGDLPRVRIVVTEHPDTVVLDHIHTGLTTKSATALRDSDQEKLRGYLDEYGYVTAGGYWTELPHGVLYRRANPGHLAERDWWRKAKVRLLRDVSCTSPGRVGEPPHVYRLGEVVEMHQSGYEGREVRRDNWWSSTDIDYANILDADAVETVEILEDRPPTWAEAALDAVAVTALLDQHHPGAAEAAAAWAAAGLLVTEDVDGLIIRTPAPERRKVGRIRRDYWHGNTHRKPYEAITNAEASMWASFPKLAALPLDPVAAAAPNQEQRDAVETVAPIAAETPTTAQPAPAGPGIEGEVIVHGYPPEGLVKLESPVGRELGPLPHHFKHSHTGFSWGYGGSGPADLARSVLIAVLGERARCAECDGTGRVVGHVEGREWRTVPFDPAQHRPDDAEVCLGCDKGISFPPGVRYQDFKAEYVALWPQEEEFEISAADVRAWIESATTAAQN